MSRRIVIASGALGAAFSILILCKLNVFNEGLAPDPLIQVKDEGVNSLIMGMPAEGKLFLLEKINDSMTDVDALSCYLGWLHCKREFLLDIIKRQRMVNEVGDFHFLLNDRNAIKKRMHDFCYTEAAFLDSLSGTDGTTSLDRDALGLEILFCKCSMSIIAQQMIQNQNDKFNWIKSWGDFDIGFIEKKGYSLGVSIDGDLNQPVKKEPSPPSTPDGK